MKKILLSFLCCMLAVIGMQAEEVTFNFKSLYGNSTLNSVTSKTVEGITISYAKNNASSAPAFNKDGTLRLYYAAGGQGGSATFTTDGTKKIVGIKITAYSTLYTPTVKYSVDDAPAQQGTWSSKTMTISGFQANNTFMIQNANTSNTQLRITEIVLTCEAVGEGGGEGGETPDPVDVAEPTFTPADGTTFEESLDVTIDVEDGLTAWYTTVENGEYTQGNALTIDATTTVWAKAVDAEGNESDVVTATYTLLAPPPAGESITNKYIFSNYATGTQYAQGEEHKLDNDVTLIINGAHLNGEVRLYAGSNAVVEVNNGVATEIILNAGNKAGTLTINGSNDGSTWTKIATQTTTSSYTNYTFSVPNYKYVQMVSAGAQIRVKDMTLTYVVDAEAVNVAEPTFSVPAGEVEQGTVVNINVEPGLTAWYTTVENGEYTQGNALTIDATTTVWAKAVDAEGNESDVVSAQYTVFIPVEGTWTLVTDANTLCNGDEVVIVAREDNMGLSTDAGNYRNQAAVKKEGNDVKFAQDVQVITLGEVGEANGVRTWSMHTAEGYLYSPGASNYLKTDADNNAAWSIAIGDEAAAGIIDMNNDADEPANVIRYNQSSARFSCYKENNSQKDIVMYRKVREANIAATMYYLLPGVWETPDAPWYAAYFYNQNDGTAEWVRGFLSEHIVYFDLEADGSFTHITFCRMNPAYQEMTFDAAPVTRSSDPEARIWDKVTVAYTGEAPVYSIDDAAWTAVATGIEGVVAANGIAYANGIVAAEGAIEVYNVNGMVVARGNESLDLRNLNAGVYIVRNGNNVRKVVR